MPVSFETSLSVRGLTVCGPVVEDLYCGYNESQTVLFTLLLPRFSLKPSIFI